VRLRRRGEISAVSWSIEKLWHYPDRIKCPQAFSAVGFEVIHDLPRYAHAKGGGVKFGKYLRGRCSPPSQLPRISGEYVIAEHSINVIRAN
jgi:hypothetical protein